MIVKKRVYKIPHILYVEHYQAYLPFPNNSFFSIHILAKLVSISICKTIEKETKKANDPYSA